MMMTNGYNTDIQLMEDDLFANYIKIKIMRCCLIIICSLYIFIESASCFAKEISDVFSHEYYYISIMFAPQNDYPEILNVMMEPADSLEINFKNMATIADCFTDKSLFLDEFNNEDVYCEIYGKKQAVVDAYLLGNSDFNNALLKMGARLKFQMSDGGNVVIQYMKVVGLFTRYRVNNDDLVEAFGTETVRKFTNICPLHIQYCEPINDFKIIPVSTQ